jgi:hypothetical protein
VADIHAQRSPVIEAMIGLPRSGLQPDPVCGLPMTAVAQIRFIIADAAKNLPPPCRATPSCAWPWIRKFACGGAGHSPLAPALTEEDFALPTDRLAAPATATLQAVARRTGIGEGVTDALIAQGDRAAIGLMLGSCSAKIFRAVKPGRCDCRGARFNPEWFPSLMAAACADVLHSAIGLAALPPMIAAGPRWSARMWIRPCWFRLRQCVADRAGPAAANLPGGLGGRQIDPVSKGFPAKSMVWRTDNGGPRF